MSKKLLWMAGALALACSGSLVAQQAPPEPPEPPPLVEVPGTDGTITTMNTAAIDLAFAAALNGTAEVPPNTSPAIGAVAVTLNPDGTSLHYRLSVAEISDVVAAHLHLGLPGENGPIVVPLLGEGAPVAAPPAGAASGVIAEGDISVGSLTGPLTGTPLAVLLELMRSGAIYANVHTTAMPAGEIRGQIDGLGPDLAGSLELLQGMPVAPAPGAAPPAATPPAEPPSAGTPAP